MRSNGSTSTEKQSSHFKGFPFPNTQASFGTGPVF